MTAAALALSTAQNIAQLGIADLALISTKKSGLYNLNDPTNNSYPDIIAMVTIEEKHSDEMIITDHPIEQGASISDHCYKMPAKLTMRLGWSNSPNLAQSSLLEIGNNMIATYGGQVGQIATSTFSFYQAGYNLLNAKDKMKDIYQSLIDLQNNKIIFNVYTKKRIYYNMMAKGIHTETDSSTINSLPVTLECQEVIIVNTQVATISKEQLKSGFKANSSIKSTGQNAVSKPNVNPSSTPQQIVPFS